MFHEGARGARFHHAANGRVSGPASDRSSYGSFASFSDPDGNGWLFQEVTTRLPGRIDSAETSFASASDLASALRRASAAHGEHEERTGEADANWPDWYAEYMVRGAGGRGTALVSDHDSNRNTRSLEINSRRIREEMVVRIDVQDDLQISGRLALDDPVFSHDGLDQRIR